MKKYRILGKVRDDELLAERLRELGVSRAPLGSLGDGIQHLEATVDDDGFVDTWFVYGEQMRELLFKLAPLYGVTLVSEDQPEFWDVTTEEEMNEAKAGYPEREKVRAQKEVLNFLRRKPAALEQKDRYCYKTCSMLVIEDPSLVEPGNEERLWKKFEEEIEVDQRIDYMLELKQYLDDMRFLRRLRRYNPSAGA